MRHQFNRSTRTGISFLVLAILIVWFCLHETTTSPLDLKDRLLFAVGAICLLGFVGIYKTNTSAAEDQLCSPGVNVQALIQENRELRSILLNVGLNAGELLVELRDGRNIDHKLRALKSLKFVRDFAKGDVPEEFIEASDAWLDVMCAPGEEMPLALLCPDVWTGK